MRMLKQKEKRRVKKKCSLCKEMEARTLCESDEASLCWKCDWKVHGANFLVARHIRYLLCSVCHSPTPWSASGPFLSHSLALCHTCSSVNSHHQEEQEGENQVVPLSSDSPPTSSSSTTQEYESRV